MPEVKAGIIRHLAALAYLDALKQLLCNQWVGSSSLSGGTIVFKGLAVMRWALIAEKRGDSDIAQLINLIKEKLQSEVQAGIIDEVDALFEN